MLEKYQMFYPAAIDQRATNIWLINGCGFYRYYGRDRSGELYGNFNTIFLRSQPTSSSSFTNESNCFCIKCRLFDKLLPCPLRLITPSSVDIISCELLLLFLLALCRWLLSKRACISSLSSWLGSRSKLAWYKLRNIVRLEKSSCTKKQGKRKKKHPPPRRLHQNSLSLRFRVLEVKWLLVSWNLLRVFQNNLSTWK